MNAHPAYPKELADTIAKAIERIRDGEYRQGYGSYHADEETHCAVGIVLDNSGLGSWQRFNPGGGYAYVPNDKNLDHLMMFSLIDDDFLPLLGLTESGLIDKVDEVTGVYQHGTSLVELYDVERWSLEEIADRMEQCLTCTNGWTFVNPVTNRAYLTTYLQEHAR
jgi:hypothetical protein